MSTIIAAFHFINTIWGLFPCLFFLDSPKLRTTAPFLVARKRQVTLTNFYTFSPWSLLLSLWFNFAHSLYLILITKSLSGTGIGVFLTNPISQSWFPKTTHSKLCLVFLNILLKKCFYVAYVRIEIIVGFQANCALFWNRG